MLLASIVAIRSEIDTELDRVHADCFDDRKQDRCEDQNRRSRVHHHADDQQKAVEHEQERDCPST